MDTDMNELNQLDNNSPTKPHAFLRHPLGKFPDPEDDIGKCWEVVNHHYCGLSVDDKIHQSVSTNPSSKEVAMVDPDALRKLLNKFLWDKYALHC